MSSQTFHIIRGVAIVMVAGAFVVWVFIRAFKRSDDPEQLLFKWFLTALVVGFIVWQVGPLVQSNDPSAAYVGVPLTAFCGLVLAAIWRRNIANFVAKPIGSLYDGGNDEIEARPMYSFAVTKRKRGKYNEAIAELRKQLAKFPNDVEGQMLLAEIQAENLNDLAGAQVTIQRMCGQPGHSPGNIALAWNTLADWHLKYSQDREAARQALEKIIETLPDSEFAALASQRVAHLAPTEHLIASHDRPRLHLHTGVQDVGLLQSSAHLVPKTGDPAALAADHVKHLEQHPLDTERREKLAMIYAEHFQRADMAIDQLEQLVNCPNQPDKRVVHWLNAIADLQIKHNSDLDSARATLQRIIEQFPKSAAADTAQRRRDLLKLSLKANETKQDVKMGNYEQDIGVKR